MCEYMQNIKFWRACEEGDLITVQEAINSGNVDLDWHKEGSPYYVCCIREHSMYSQYISVK